MRTTDPATNSTKMARAQGALDIITLLDSPDELANYDEKLEEQERNAR